MTLRKSFFLWVSLLFIVATAVSTFVTNIEVRKRLEGAKARIDTEIVQADKKQQENMLTYLEMNAEEIETRLVTILRSVQNIGWLNQRFSPSLYNFETFDWESSGRLLLMNESIDLIQSIDEGKLTSLVALRPPFFQHFVRIPVGDLLSVILQIQEEKIEAFIGIPFWSNEAITMITKSDQQIAYGKLGDTDDWLLFTVDQILHMNVDKVERRLVFPEGPLLQEITEQGVKEYEKILNQTLALIKLSKKRLAENSTLMHTLQTKELREKWAEEQLSLMLKKNVGSPSAFLRTEESTQEQVSIRSWVDRYQQNRMIWELGFITGAGIWQYNPLDSFAPKGIVSMLRGDLVVEGRIRWALGFFAKDIYHAKPLPIDEDCTPTPVKGKTTTCIGKKLQLFGEDPLQGLYLSKTLFFANWEDPTKPVRHGSLTVGINIMVLLQDLALASPNQILFVDKSGKNTLFTNEGKMLSLPPMSLEQAQAVIAKKSDTSQNFGGKEYFFVHLHSMGENSGSVFIVVSNDIVTMLKELNTQALSLIRNVSWYYILVSLIALIVTLLVLDRVIKRVVNPIHELALATTDIGAGNYSAVQISEEGKERQGEIGILCRSFEEMVKQMKQAEEVRGILDKVVSKQVAAKILKEGVKLGGEVREVTVLFCDIRQFAKITEEMSPEVVLDMLNGCLTILSRAIDEHEGVIDKYIGDEVMALFGAPLDQKNAALQAVLSAIDMRTVMKEWNEQRRLRGLCILPIGIGIHTASVIAGNIGAENHLSYTVLGHGVNLASRTCEAAGEMEILITRATLEAPGVKEAIQVEPLSPLIPRGLSTPVEFFRVL